MADASKPIAPHHLSLMDLLVRIHEDVYVVTGLPSANDSPFRDRLFERGGDVVFIGMDVGREPSIGVEGVWRDGELVEVREVKPRRRARREAFPSPEPMAYRPKAW